MHVNEYINNYFYIFILTITNTCNKIIEKHKDILHSSENIKSNS